MPKSKATGGILPGIDLKRASPEGGYERAVILTDVNILVHAFRADSPEHLFRFLYQF